MTIDEFKIYFDKQFSDYINNRVARYKDFTTNERILQMIEQSAKITNHGKRVRPYLIYLSYALHGGRDFASIKPILFAVEVFHAFCLIHDDIIDEDDHRRNIQTVHSLAQSLYSHLEEIQNDPNKTGNAQGILVGDLAFSWVFELLLSHPKAHHLLQEMFFTIDEVVIGQMIDVDISIRTEVSRSEIMEKMHLKTAGYTFIQPLRIGRLLADLPARDKDLDQIGLEVGLAFQIQDDILDIMSDTAIIGKDAGSDAESAQHTLLTQYVFDQADQESIKELRSLLGQPMNSDRLSALRDLFIKTGAIESLNQEIKKHFSTAYSLTEGLDSDNLYKEHLFNFLKYVEERSV